MTGTATRATVGEARAWFGAGGAVMVSESGHELERRVYPSTTVHTRDTVDWDDLAGMVDMWRNRYPGQTFYVIGGAR